MATSAYPIRFYVILVLCLAIGVGSLAALGLMWLNRGPEQNAASARLTIEINEAAAKLKVKPRTIELTSEKAIRVRHAITQGDYRAASQITADVLKESRIEAWREYPFRTFIAHVTDFADPAFEAHLDEWVASNKEDAVPVLIRAQYFFDMAWFKRGEHFDRDTRAEDMASYRIYIAKALADADAVIVAKAPIPYGYDLKLRILHGAGPSPEMMRTFEAAIAQYPTYYPFYDAVLGTLDPRWGGSMAAMYDFVDRYAANVDDNSPLKFLYLSLYRDLLSAASVYYCTNQSVDRDKMDQCVTSVMAKAIMPGLEDDVVAALKLYDRLDKHQFDLAVRDVLNGMQRTAGGASYAGAVLQLAATAMHSDTQLKQDKPGSNNYVIDEAVADSWYAKGFYPNALTKETDALADVETATFPSEEEKDLEIARVYDYIAGIYDRLNQYVEMIAYEKAAVALGGPTAGAALICYGYHALKDDEDAVRECTKIIDDETNNLQARYWRGTAYRESGHPDEALKDLTAVADSESDFRVSAAIDLSMVHFSRGDNQAALDVLNKFTYLYYPNTDTKDDIAVSYNNRCYAYMQLGQYQKALDDCTASLRYGSLPDAYRKQQELIKRLGAHNG